ncbi:TatD family hydrolase [Variovorax sp. PCZ-1]|uniref:TatD family hydrolase n=1 Tax=Variovorax sp. PCZ-1 TaxID=2835533 RepID=UPI001BCC3E5C|nr:TatD family hydrolase [Variovorax sp. PCZ-1]MBS7806517.1 TatD family hydrolase [Variovorax sp. PCZ-1]
MWIDTHSHLDAPEFERNGLFAGLLVAQSAIKNVVMSIIPAVERSNFDTVRQLAHTHAQAYGLGIHPLYVPRAHEDDLTFLGKQLAQHIDDARLIAMGEIGLDFFVPALCTPEIREKQTAFYRAQLKLAKQHQLPVILHVRKSADQLLHALREIGSHGGIAHAFNGSEQQAMQFVEMGFCLGFGGTVTYERSQNIRLLAKSLPAQAIVMETDAPDIPPQWIYATAEERAAGKPQGINSPLELPRIGQLLAELRGVSAEEWAAQTTQNALRVLPKLKALL